MTDVRDLLPLYALGILDRDEASAVEAAVAADPALAVELAQLQVTAEEMVTPVAPSPDVHARLLASIGAGRFERFADRMATLFDVGVDKARELLALIERKASWEQPMPGVHLVHFAGGPAYAEADCGFIRLDDAATFPWHKHRGEEVCLVLAGTLRERSGRVLRPGDELVQSEGSEHDITAEGGEAIWAARAMNGIEVGGVPARPPR